jgi:hypothetical protein
MQQPGMQQGQQQQGPMMAGPPGQQQQGGDLMGDIKAEAKSIVIVIFLCIIFNLDQVNGLFKKLTMFVAEDGSLNMQCVFTKALLIGSLFFLVKSRLL